MTDQEGNRGRGRPTKCTPELVEKAQDYIKNYEEHNHAIPSIAGLSLVIGVSRKVIHEWRADNDPKKANFRDILDQLMANQEQVLVSNGLKNEFNSTITKLILTKHDYSDQQQVGNQPGNAFQVVINNDDADCA